MSVPAEGTEPEALELPADAGSAMAQILGFLAPEEGDQGAGEGEPPTDPPAADGGQQQPAAEGAGGVGGRQPAPAAGDGGEPNVPGAGQPGAGSDPAAAGADSSAPVVSPGTVDAESLRDEWGKVAESFESSQEEHFRQGVLSEVQEEYSRYFEAIQQHPRTLVGKEVPSATGEGMEVLKDAADAKDWQDAIKFELTNEVKSRVSVKQDEYRESFETVHSSIDLFRNNVDLVPGTKQFDRELADQFARTAKDYELRTNGKLVGYSVPVQPLINQIRTQLAERRGGRTAAQAAQAAAPTARQQQAAEQARTPQGRWDGPQAGIGSKAGRSSEDTDEAAGLLSAFARQNGFVI